MRARLQRKYLTPDCLQWLEQLEHEGPAELDSESNIDSCTVCHFLGWTQRRGRRRRGRSGRIFTGQGVAIIYELSPEGREVLMAHRRSAGRGLDGCLMNNGAAELFLRIGIDARRGRPHDDLTPARSEWQGHSEFEAPGMRLRPANEEA